MPVLVPAARGSSPTTRPPARARRRGARVLVAIALATAAGSGAVTPAAGAAIPADRPAPAGPVAVQLLAINDLHGALEPPTGPGGLLDGTPAGGMEHLSTRLQQLSAEVPTGGTVTVAAGDLIGASPLLSAAFHDEPAVEALDLAGLDVAAIGNHELDEGPAELLRVQRGGCHPVDGCADPQRPWSGAGFGYLAANTVVERTGQPLLPPYAIREVGGVRVGLIGMTLAGTPEVVARSGVAGLRFTDEIETGNRYVAELQRQGVQTIVVLLHQGGWPSPGVGVDGCGVLEGPIVPIVEGLSDAVDVVVSGHTHQAYNCVVDGRIVTSGGSDGRVVTDIDLRVDPGTGRVLAGSARNIAITREVPADPRQTAVIDRYRALLGTAGAPVVGVTTTAVTRSRERLLDQRGESALGNLIADAQLAGTTALGAVAAFVDPDGIRADLDAGPVGAGEAHAALPFNNYLTTLDLTGAQLDCLLEQQFVVGRTLQPSASVGYAVDPGGRTGSAADPCAGTRVNGLTVAGAPVLPDGRYRITVNDFLADGGDGFGVLTGGSDRTVGMLDVQALAGYLAAGPVTAPATDRITIGAPV